MCRSRETYFLFPEVPSFSRYWKTSGNVDSLEFGDFPCNNLVLVGVSF